MIQNAMVMMLVKLGKYASSNGHLCGTNKTLSFSILTILSPTRSIKTKICRFGEPVKDNVVDADSRCNLSPSIIKTDRGLCSNKRHANCLTTKTKAAKKICTEETSDEDSGSCS